MLSFSHGTKIKIWATSAVRRRKPLSSHKSSEGKVETEFMRVQQPIPNGEQYGN